MEAYKARFAGNLFAVRKDIKEVKPAVGGGGEELSMDISQGIEVLE